MVDADKRLKYFNGQVLQQEDFIDEQAYHLDRLRRHFRQLHTPGIAEGLVVTADVGDSSVTVQPGTAIDTEGRPIVLLEPRTVPVGTLAGQQALVVISYRESPAVPAATGVKEDTRWLEDPNVGVIPESDAMAGDDRIPLARLRIDTNHKVAEPQDKSVRTSAGTKVGTELPIERIQLSRQGVAPDLWPVLSSGAQNRADVTGDLSVEGNVLVTGTLDGRDVSADGAKLDTHVGSTSNPHSTTAAQVGAITGVGTISNPGGQVGLLAGNNLSITPDSTNKQITIASATVKGVSNPGGNIDLLGQNGITVTGDNTTKTITIAGTAGTLTTQNPFGAASQFVQDQNGSQSPLAIGTGRVGIGTKDLGYVFTIAGNISAGPIAEARSQGNESSIRYVNNNDGAWHAGVGPANNFFFLNKTTNSSTSITPDGTLTANSLKLSRQGVAADVTGDISVAGKVLVTGTVDGRDVSADGAKLDTHAGSTNNPHSTTAAQVGAIMGVGGVSNPGGQVDLVAGNNISITPDSLNKRITIANTVGSLAVQNPLGASPQAVQDQAGTQSLLAIGTAGVQIATNDDKLNLLTISGNHPGGGTLVRVENKNVEASIQYANSSAVSWNVGSVNDSFFFWNSQKGHALFINADGTISVQLDLAVSGNLTVNGNITLDGGLNNVPLESKAPDTTRLRTLKIDPMTGKIYHVL